MGDIGAKCMREASLHHVGLSTPAGGQAVSDEQVLFENEMAGAYSKYSFHLIANRTLRELWLFSWPTRWVRTLDKETTGAVEVTVRELRRDWELDRIVRSLLFAFARVGNGRTGFEHGQSLGIRSCS